MSEIRHYDGSPFLKIEGDRINSWTGQPLIEVDSIGSVRPFIGCHEYKVDESTGDIFEFAGKGRWYLRSNEFGEFARSPEYVIRGNEISPYCGSPIYKIEGNISTKMLIAAFTLIFIMGIKEV